ncbi:MAG: hypothetical protein IJL72_09545 [Lachnospiraceae bacterium]|nr:hypothetical protein [Lachnospiraceae bacterium]
MINITLQIERIDYQKSVENLLPQLVKEAEAKKSPNGFEQFVARLGKDAVPVAKKLLRYMSDDLKDGLVVWMAESRQESIVAAVNQQLDALLGNAVMKVGALHAEDRPGTRMVLVASQVETDYAALSSSPVVESALGQLGGENSLLKGAAKFALQMVTKANPETLEKQGIALLSSDRVKPKILSALSGALGKIGLEATLGDMTVNAGAGPAAAAIGTELPAALKDRLMDAVIAFLKANA